MFQSSSDKGLFTFYWEQSHPSSPNFQHPQKQTLEPKALQQICKNHAQIEANKSKPQKIIEAKPSITKHISEQIFKPKIKDQPRCQHLYAIQFEADFDHLKKKNSIRRIRNKQNKTLHMIKKSCQLPVLKNINSDKNNNSTDIIEQLIHKQQSFSPRLLLEIQEQATNGNIIRTNRMKKVRKTDKSCQAGKKTDRLSSQVDSYIFCEQKAPANKFPTLTHQPKKPKKVKNKYFIQKLLIERQQIQRSGSVINLGTDSTQQHLARWNNRKNQFLRLLKRNLSCNILK